MIRLLVLSLLVLLSFGSAMAGDIDGRVIGVSDGDTISVLDARHQVHKIRLAGIDAPEKAQPFGQRSKAGLSSTVFNREVEVIGSKRDRYEAAETEARQQRMGLWQDKDPTPPWDWRRQPRPAARTMSGG